ncbi:antitoxin Xre/MbcA/ParS toxin-binding domain-containing protein [Sphingomonas sp. CFBP 8760]|uniref:antitoxin Xre/MbcA/ParS toxin-binding domain-containing protein n=1 Tax=Sphingomonas sp. CFBP 8760 TaxID=2775282 RepID=UPI001FCE8839|nr:antitoxin Xre/MbcA/ParS toxin-binding domain-containing protein [Sphingomonas sp. CFBP 8760]
MAVEAKGIGRKRAAATMSPAIALAGQGFVTHFLDQGGIVDMERVADIFRMTKGQLAETVGLGAATIGKAERRTAPRAQSRVREMLEIVARIRDWAGGETQAMAWYRSQPIPALDGRTPEALVKAGEAGAVRDYLDHLALGGFA